MATPSPGLAGELSPAATGASDGVGLPLLTLPPDAGRRGTDVLALIWRNLPKPARLAEVEAFVAEMESINSSGRGRVEAYMDERISPSGSIHQKTVVVRSPATANRTVAYVGGGRPPRPPAADPRTMPGHSALVRLAPPPLSTPRAAAS